MWFFTRSLPLVHLLLQDSPLRSSSSPPNSTGSTADSDGWTSGPPASCPQRPPKVPQDRSRKRPQSGATLSSHIKRDVSWINVPSHLFTCSLSPLLICDTFFSLLQQTITTLHPDDRRKSDKLKKKRRKEREHQVGEVDDTQQEISPVPEMQFPVSFSGRMIKEEPEDDISIPLHPQHLPSPSTCKEEPKEEHSNWGGRDMEEGVVKVQKVEGFSGSRTVFRQGKQVVFRDEDGSGEDEDIMVDSGETLFCSVHWIGISLTNLTQWILSCLFRWRLVGPGHMFLHEAFCGSGHDRV